MKSRCQILMLPVKSIHALHQIRPQIQKKRIEQPYWQPAKNSRLDGCQKIQSSGLPLKEREFYSLFQSISYPLHSPLHRLKQIFRRPGPGSSFMAKGCFQAAAKSYMVDWCFAWS